MPRTRSDAPNPRRQAAGQRNRLLRRELSEAGRAKLRETINRNQPWRYSTGPITEAGKNKSSQNGRWCQRGLISQRELKRFVAGAMGLMGDTAALRKAILHGTTSTSQNGL